MSDTCDRASDDTNIHPQAHPEANGYQPMLQNESDVLMAPVPVPHQSISPRTRDHLANERTYLAWMRTAIALMGFGVLIARLRYLISPDVPGTGHGWALGLMFALIGLTTVFLAAQHYFSVSTAIDAETYEPSHRWVILFSLVLLLLGGGVIYVLFSMPSELRLIPLE